MARIGTRCRSGPGVPARSRKSLDRLPVVDGSRTLEAHAPTLAVAVLHVVRGQACEVTIDGLLRHDLARVGMRCELGILDPDGPCTPRLVVAPRTPVDRVPTAVWTAADVAGAVTGWQNSLGAQHERARVFLLQKPRHTGRRSSCGPGRRPMLRGCSPALSQGDRGNRCERRQDQSSDQHPTSIHEPSSRRRHPDRGDSFIHPVKGQRKDGSSCDAAPTEVSTTYCREVAQKMRIG